MSFLQSSRRGSAMVGIGVAALVMLALMFVVSEAVVRWCPRGKDCEEASQVLFGLGLIVSLAFSVAIGFVVRDIVDRMAAKRPG